jgi:hypothetical protein
VLMCDVLTVARVGTLFGAVVVIQGQCSLVLHTSPGLATMDSVDSSFSPASFTSFSRVGSRVDSFGLESLVVTI